MSRLEEAAIFASAGLVELKTVADIASVEDQMMVRQFIEGAKWLLAEAKKHQRCGGHPYRECKCEGKEIAVAVLEKLVEE